MLLLQTQQAVDAAGQLWGPAGIIIATLVIAIIGFLAWLVRDQKSTNLDLQNQRIEEAKAYGEELREIERDVLDSLRDVLNLLDRLESSDARTNEAVKDLKDKISEQHGKILDNLNS